MSTEEKLIALEELLKEIQKEIPNATVKEIKVNKAGTFEGYVIIPIEHTNITVLENMNDDVHEAIFIMDNAKIENIIGKMTKSQAKQQDGVESANHTDGYSDYVERIIGKAKGILRYPEKQLKQEGVKRKSQQWYDRFKTRGKQKI